MYLQRRGLWQEVYKVHVYITTELSFEMLLTVLKQSKLILVLKMLMPDKKLT
jgi:hypothetical protein